MSEQKYHERYFMMDHEWHHGANNLFTALPIRFYITMHIEETLINVQGTLLYFKICIRGSISLYTQVCRCTSVQAVFNLASDWILLQSNTQQSNFYTIMALAGIATLHQMFNVHLHIMVAKVQ